MSYRYPGSHGDTFSASPLNASRSFSFAGGWDSVAWDSQQSFQRSPVSRMKDEQGQNKWDDPLFDPVESFANAYGVNATIGNIFSVGGVTGVDIDAALPHNAYRPSQSGRLAATQERGMHMQAYAEAERDMHAYDLALQKRLQDQGARQGREREGERRGLTLAAHSTSSSFDRTDYYRSSPSRTAGLTTSGSLSPRRAQSSLPQSPR
jgi:hypothetical protein